MLFFGLFGVGGLRGAGGLLVGDWGFLSLLFSWVLGFALIKYKKMAHYFLHISSLTGFHILILFRLANMESCFLYCHFHR